MRKLARGAPRATLAVQIFADYQCLFPARVMPTLEAVIEHYRARVRLVYRDSPLSFHVRARPAAEAALEARAQRGDAAYFAMHDLVFENEGYLTPEGLERYTGVVGLDLVRSAIHRGVARRDAVEIDGSYRRPARHVIPARTGSSGTHLLHR